MKTYQAGIDVGSTTVKLVVLDENGQMIFGQYQRHLSHTQRALSDLLKQARAALGECALELRATGSGAINLAKALGIAPEYLTAPRINNGMEFIFALLENEQSMGFKVIKVSSTKSALVAEGLGGNTQLIFGFLNEWGEKQRQLEAKEITWEEYEDWKISYDRRVFVDDMFEGN